MAPRPAGSAAGAGAVRRQGARGIHDDGEEAGAEAGAGGAAVGSGDRTDGAGHAAV